MSIEKEFRSAVRGHLERLNAQLIPVLKQLISHEYPDEVFAICFEIFPDSFSSGFPIRAFFMDEDNSEYFIEIAGEAEYPCPVDPGLLEIDEVYPEELEATLEASAEELDPWAIASHEAALWFLERWRQAGGNAFPLEATIAEHDSSEELNLKTGEWQESYALFES